MVLRLLLVEDNLKLQAALKTGLEGSGEVRVVHGTDRGEAALAFCLEVAEAGPSEEGARICRMSS